MVGKEHGSDVSSQNDAVKTDVFEVDISGELLHKGTLYGQGPFLFHSIGFFLAE